MSYQAAFGAEHLLHDREAAYAFFLREYAQVKAEDTALCEAISARYVRVSLAAWKNEELPSEWLFQLFYLTAGKKTVAATGEIVPYLDQVQVLAQAGKLPFTAAQWAVCRREYESGDGGAVRHSAIYRAAEKPAYRIVSTLYSRYIPWLKQTRQPAGKTDAVSALSDTDMQIMENILRGAYLPL